MHTFIVAGRRVDAAKDVGERGCIAGALLDPHYHNYGAALVKDAVDGRWQGTFAGAQRIQPRRFTTTTRDQHRGVERELGGISVGGGTDQADDTGANGGDRTGTGVNIDDLDTMKEQFRHVLGLDGHGLRSCRHHGFAVHSHPLGGFPVVAAIENPA